MVLSIYFAFVRNVHRYRLCLWKYHSLIFFSFCVNIKVRCMVQSWLMPVLPKILTNDLAAWLSPRIATKNRYSPLSNFADTIIDDNIKVSDTEIEEVKQKVPPLCIYGINNYIEFLDKIKLMIVDDFNIKNLWKNTLSPKIFDCIFKAIKILAFIARHY